MTLGDLHLWLGEASRLQIGMFLVIGLCVLISLAPGGPKPAVAPSQAYLYQSALNAEHPEEGLRYCARITDPEAGAECGVAVRMRFRSYGDCDSITVDTWRDECRMLGAELLAEQGTYGPALNLCRTGVFAEQCSDHVIGVIAAEHADQTAEEAAKAWEGIPGFSATAADDARFWRLWHAVRVKRGLESP